MNLGSPFINSAIDIVDILLFISARSSSFSEGACGGVGETPLGGAFGPRMFVSSQQHGGAKATASRGAQGTGAGGFRSNRREISRIRCIGRGTAPWRTSSRPRPARPPPSRPSFSPPFGSTPWPRRGVQRAGILVSRLGGSDPSLPQRGGARAQGSGAQGARNPPPLHSGPRDQATPLGHSPRGARSAPALQTGAPEWHGLGENRGRLAHP